MMMLFVVRLANTGKRSREMSVVGRMDRLWPRRWKHRLWSHTSLSCRCTTFVALRTFYHSETVLIISQALLEFFICLLSTFSVHWLFFHLELWIQFSIILCQTLMSVPFILWKKVNI